jgi:hypothetical protein
MQPAGVNAITIRQVPAPRASLPLEVSVDPIDCRLREVIADRQAIGSLFRTKAIGGARAAD